MELLKAGVGFLDQHWMIVSLLAPAMWALVNMIDVYFVDGVYDNEWDATIISSLFQILPWLSLLFVPVSMPFIVSSTPSGFSVDWAVLLAVAGGLFFFLCFYFYFKALFHHNDVAMLQVIWNLTVIFVPLLTFIFWREVLPSYKYWGMAVTLCGATLISFSSSTREKISRKYIMTMFWSVLLLSVSMILEDKAYGLLDARGLGQTGFWIGFLYFCLGYFLGGVLVAVIIKRNPWPLIRKYYKVFLLGEGLMFVGTLASQRAISLAPSVSYVATVETFVPVFVVIYSLALVGLVSFFIKSKKESAQRIYAEQFSSGWIKIAATVIMALGVYLVSA